MKKVFEKNLFLNEYKNNYSPNIFALYRQYT